MQLIVPTSQLSTKTCQFPIKNQYNDRTNFSNVHISFDSSISKKSQATVPASFNFVFQITELTFPSILHSKSQTLKRRVVRYDKYTLNRDLNSNKNQHLELDLQTNKVFKALAKLNGLSNVG